MRSGRQFFMKPAFLSARACRSYDKIRREDEYKISQKYGNDIFEISFTVVKNQGIQTW